MLKKFYLIKEDALSGKITMRKNNITKLPVMFLCMALICTVLYSTGVITVPVYRAAEKTFTVGFDAEFPPYGYKDDKGEYVGFDLDLAAEVCSRRGWTLKKQPIDWDSKDMELSSGTIDCIWNGFTIDGREDQYTWSVPYVDNSQVVVVKSDSGIQKPADLKDQIVIVQKDSSALAAFTGEDAADENKALAESFKELQQVGDYNTAFLNLESGMAQAVCMDIGVARYQIQQRGNKFRMLDDKISSEKYGVGFKLGNTELRDQVQETLYEMKADGKFDEIAKKWNLETSVCLKAEKKTEKEDRTFTVGFDAEFPPYGYKDDKGEYVGFDLDLAAEVCSRRGWTLKKQPIDWDSKDMELSSGTIDCIWNGFTIDGREDQYTWSVPYVDNSQVVVVKSDSGIQKPSDLKDKIVIVQKDSSALAAFTGEDASDENKVLAESFKELQQVGDYNTAFLNLESGMAQAVCMDIGVAGYQIQQRGNKFRMLDDKISSEKYGVGFKLGNTELRDKVQETLYEMKADGKFDEIAKKWNLETSVCLTDGSDTAAAADDTEKAESSVPAQSSSKKDIDYLSMFLQLLDGMKATLLIFVLTLVFSMPLGLLLTFIRMSRFKVLQIIARVYISIMRGTPLMLQLLVVCFGPYYVFGIPLDDSYRFYAVIIGFSLNYAAYFAEIFRAGIQAVPNGQREAASILGYSKAQTFGRIIFPQMAKNVLPPVTNEIITLVKDTSLAFVLTYTEIFTLAKQIAAAQANIIPLFAAGLFYYVFNALVAFAMSKIEKKMNYYK